MKSVIFTVTSVLALYVSHLTAERHDTRFLVFFRAPVSCAGTIVAPNWVITAAHPCCSNSSNAKDYWMVAGSPECYQERQGDTLHIHPNGTEDLPNYFALVQVTPSWSIGQHVSVLHMFFGSFPRYPALNNGCFAAGWNRNVRNDDDHKKAPLPSSFLLTTARSEQCRQRLNKTVPENNLCAQDQFGSWDVSEKNFGGYPCAGDLGGPLVCDIFTEDGELKPMMTGVMLSYDVLLVNDRVEMCRLVFYAETGSLVAWIRPLLPDITTEGLEEPIRAKSIGVQDEESSAAASATVDFDEYSLQVVLSCSGVTVLTVYGAPATKLISMFLTTLFFLRIATFILLFLNFFQHHRIWRRFGYIVSI